MADKTRRGRFVWHELMTSDSVAAYGFYAKTLGWKTVTPEGDAAHTSLAGPAGPIANASQLDDGASSWIPYVGSDDLEQTISDATERGASVAKSITDVPGGGRYVHLTDPHGAVFGVYSSDDPVPREAPAKRGDYSWHELATTHVNAAFEFYAALFGWEKLDEHDMGPDDVYLVFGRNGKPLGGIYRKMPEQPDCAWLGYVRVKDVEKIVKKVKSAGGKLINGPMDVPGGDRIAQFLDPQGAMFAVHALAADLQPAAPKSEAAPADAPAAADEDDASAAAPEPAAAAPAKKAAVKKSAPKKPPTRKVAAEEDETQESEEAEVEKPVAKKSAAKKPASKKKAPTKVAAKAKTPARKTAKKKVKKAAKKAAKPAAKKKSGRKVAKKAARPAKKKSKVARKAK